MESRLRTILLLPRSRRLGIGDIRPETVDDLELAQRYALVDVWEVSGATRS
jgi:hypothetical protein